MRTMRKAAALTVALGLAVTGSMSSYAAETLPEETKVSYATKSLSNGQGADSTITGHIQITNISVEVPITSSFDIDPNKEAKANAGADAQMGQQADNYKITNLSTVPLDISITKVAPSEGVTLVDTVDALSTDKSVLFAIREANEAVPTLPGTKNNAVWMNKADIEGGAPYYVKGSSAYTIQAADDTADGGADTLKMKVYAATKKGWKSGNSFTITPTFTVSLTTE